MSQFDVLLRFRLFSEIIVVVVKDFAANLCVEFT